MKSDHPLLILIAGPYLSGTNGDADLIAANLAKLEALALPVFNRGHLAVIGEWFALPIIHTAGGISPGDEVFKAYQYPVAHRLISRCDGVLRIAGASTGADLDVARARELGLPIYTRVEDIPSYTPEIGAGGAV